MPNITDNFALLLMCMMVSAILVGGLGAPMRMLRVVRYVMQEIRRLVGGRRPQPPLYPWPEAGEAPDILAIATSLNDPAVAGIAARLGSVASTSALRPDELPQIDEPVAGPSTAPDSLPRRPTIIISTRPSSMLIPEPIPNRSSTPIPGPSATSTPAPTPSTSAMPESLPRRPSIIISARASSSTSVSSEKPTTSGTCASQTGVKRKLSETDTGRKAKIAKSCTATCKSSVKTPKPPAPAPKQATPTPKLTTPIPSSTPTSRSSTPLPASRVPTSSSPAHITSPTRRSTRRIPPVEVAPPAATASSTPSTSSAAEDRAGDTPLASRKRSLEDSSEDSGSPRPRRARREQRAQRRSSLTDSDSSSSTPYPSPSTKKQRRS